MRTRLRTAMSGRDLGHAEAATPAVPPNTATPNFLIALTARRGFGILLRWGREDSRRQERLSADSLSVETIHTDQPTAISPEGKLAIPAFHRGVSAKDYSR